MELCCNKWLEINDVEITHSIIHYLTAIDFLITKNWYARGVDISKKLNITAWSCSISLKNLLKKWLIFEDENRFIILSELWKNVIKKANTKKEVLFNFFTKVLWVDESLADINACNISHNISDEIVDKLNDFIKKD